MNLATLRALLSGGDRRAIGQSDKVAILLADDPSLFDLAVALMLDANPLVRMRSADAVEKASRANPSLLQPHVAALLGPLSEVEQQEVRWHLLQMLSRPELSDEDRLTAFGLAETSLQHESRIVQAEGLSALFAIAQTDRRLVDRARYLASEVITSGAPAVRARARKLLAEQQDGAALLIRGGASKAAPTCTNNRSSTPAAHL